MSWVAFVTVLTVIAFAVAYGRAADRARVRAYTHLRDMGKTHAEAAERARQAERNFNEEQRKLRVRLNKTQAEIDAMHGVVQEDVEDDDTAEVLQEEPEDDMLVLAGDGSAQDIITRGKE